MTEEQETTVEVYRGGVDPAHPRFLPSTTDRAGDCCTATEVVSGYLCTRSPGHEPEDHAAHGGPNLMYARWPSSNEENPS